MKRQLLIAALLLVEVPLLAEFPHEKHGGGPPPNQNFAEKQKGMGQRAMNSPAMQKLQAARELALTPDQQSKLNALESKARQEMMQLRDEIKPEMKQQLSAGGKPGEGGNQDQRREIMQQLRPKMEAIGREVSTGIDAILTNEQRTELAQKTGQGGNGGGRPFGGHTFGAGAIRGGQGSPPAAVATPLPTRVPVAQQVPANSTTSGTLAAVNPFVP